MNEETHAFPSQLIDDDEKRATPQAVPREDRCHEECPQCIQDTTHNGGPARVHQVTSGAAAIIPVILRRVVHVRGMRNVINVSKRTVDMYIGAIYKTVRYSTRIYEYQYRIRVPVYIRVSW